jgi:purine-binding chemotaxis protein CheW
VDAVGSVIETSTLDIITADQLLPGLEYVAGVLTLADGMVLIHDLDTCLSLEEAKPLNDTLKGT